jgi:hypothetical protein
MKNTATREMGIINLRVLMINSLDSQSEKSGKKSTYSKENNRLLTNRLLYKVHFNN